jgi:valyl-tRNA synthetase
LERNDAAIRRLARMSDVSLGEEAPEGSAQIVVGEATVCLPLKGLVDFAAEISRLEKEIEGIDKDLKVVGGKLNNEKFVANAPDAVVQENRDRLAELEEKHEIVNEALQRVRSFN